MLRAHYFGAATKDMPYICVNKFFPVFSVNNFFSCLSFILIKFGTWLILVELTSSNCKCSHLKHVFLCVCVFKIDSYSVLWSITFAFLHFAHLESSHFRDIETFERFGCLIIILLVIVAAFFSLALCLLFHCMAVAVCGFCTIWIVRYHLIAIILLQ